MKEYFKVFISALLAGLLIALGATSYLVCCTLGHKIVGTFLFGTGLFMIIQFRLWLYTGKIGYCLHNKFDYCLKLIICLVGNLLGAGLFTLLIKTSNVVSSDLIDLSITLCTAKQSLTWYQILLSSIGCGVLIYLAVEGSAKSESSLIKVLFIFLAIMLFILCGFDHVVANICYYTYAGYFDLRTIGWFALMAVGNSIGSIIIDYLLNLTRN